jgi:alanine dehydrogenase
MEKKKEAIRSLAQAAILPQEELLKTTERQESLTIAIPKEVSFQENRVALVPEAVALLTSRGHRVLVETGAGTLSHFSDNDYSEAGAEIIYDRGRIFKSQIIMKVAPLNAEESAMLEGKQTLFSALQLSAHPKDTLKVLAQKRMTAIAWDFIKDETGIYPVVRSMGEIAGNTSVLIAAEYMSSAKQGSGRMFGGISGVKPTSVVILGAGTAGEFAARAAIGLGASVKVFDNSIYKLRRLQNDLGLRLWTSTIQPDTLKEALRTADVAIGAIHATRGRTPCVVTEEMVRQMRSGSVIVDISIDQGGCFETSRVTNHSDPVYRLHDIIHYCVPNIASRVSRTASFALSNIFAPIILNIGDEGGIVNEIKRHEGFRNGVYLFNGTLVSPVLGEAFDMPYKDLDLILPAL